jgi:biotin carboxyl carrier protein
VTMYRVSVGDREYQVEVAGSRLRINGEQIQANLTALNELGLYLLRRGNERREMHISVKGANTFTALAEGRQLIALVERQTSPTRRKVGAAAQTNVCAPMPGVVIKALVAEGDPVEKGQAVMVMESMKMQMELRASTAGTVEKVAVQPHTQVDKGTLLVKITA